MYLFNYIMVDGWRARSWTHCEHDESLNPLYQVMGNFFFFLLIIHLMWHTVLRYVEYVHSSLSFYLFYSSTIFSLVHQYSRYHTQQHYFTFVVTAIFFFTKLFSAFHRRECKYIMCGHINIVVIIGIFHIFQSAQSRWHCLRIEFYFFFSFLNAPSNI